MAWKKKIDLSRAVELLSYDKSSGLLTWKGDMKGGKRKGDVAGSKAQHGYITVRVDGHLYYAHRLVWLIQYGEWPEMEIDHINRDRTDNRIANLRVASRKQQSGNLTLKSNASGVRGVYPGKAKKWVAQINRNGKQVHLGTYLTIKEAKAVYLAAAQDHFGEFFGGD